MKKSSGVPSPRCDIDRHGHKNRMATNGCRPFHASPLHILAMADFISREIRHSIPLNGQLFLQLLFNVSGLLAPPRWWFLDVATRSTPRLSTVHCHWRVISLRRRFSFHPNASRCQHVRKQSSWFLSLFTLVPLSGGIIPARKPSRVDGRNLLLHQQQ